ncbi:MAG TPA: hypothetical protein VEQ36_09845 [Thermomicrobiales bacterium]|nr:hypothetical protein [Thermomicrobiales bacterium]
MDELSDTGKAIARARREILARLSNIRTENQPDPSPKDLIVELARDRDRDPYRAAITSLIASGVVEASPRWKLRLRSELA